jgi:hypothetical protein
MAVLLLDNRCQYLKDTWQRNLETLAIFRLVAEEFADMSDEVVNNYLALADAKVASWIHDNVRGEFVAYLAAHQIDLARKRKGSGGQVVSLSEGKLAIKYAEGGRVRSDLDLSSYGRMYQLLIKSNVPTIITENGF